MSERARLALLTVCAVLPLLLFAGLAMRANVAQDEARITADRVALVTAAAQSTSAHVNGSVSTLRAVAIAPAVTDPELRTQLPEFLARVAAQNPDWEGVALLDTDGWDVASSGGEVNSVNVSDRPYFQQVMATGAPTVSEPLLGRRRDRVTIVLAEPVGLNNGRRAVLVAPLSVARLQSQLQSLFQPEGIQAIVVDGQGRAFVHPQPEQARALISLRGRPEVEAVLRGETGAQRAVGADGQQQLAAHAPIPEFGWGVVASQPAEIAFAPARSALINQLLLLTLALGVVALIVWYLGGRLAAYYQATVEASARAEEARAEAERVAQRTAFLARMTQELATSLDYETTLRTVARLAVPQIADWCAVDVLEDDGTLHRVAVAHADPTKVQLAEQLEHRYPPGVDSAPWRVIRKRQSELYEDLSDELLRQAAANPAHLEILRGLGVRSAMVVPLLARGNALGTLTLASAQAGQQYGPRDVAFAEGVAARAALAVDNARLYRDVQQGIQTRDEFLAVASHDLKNPLTAIQAAAQIAERLLQRKNLPDADRALASVAIIDSAASRMGGLIDGLLDLARLHVGQPLDLDRNPTDLGALARQVALEAQAATQQHEIRVQAGGEVVGDWDARRLERVIGNLLDNAIKYSPKGGEIRVDVRREERNGAPHALLRVVDQGLGIPATDLPRVFDRFHRGSNVVGHFAGTGLGLAGARQIVEQHGGTMSLESEEGQGTTITVELPLG